MKEHSSRRIHLWRFSIPLLLLPLLATPEVSRAVVFRVGNDGIPPCTHTDLASAVAAAAANGTGLDQIYLTDPVTLASTLDINNQAVEIVGGFSDCNDNTPSATTSVSMQANPGFLVHGGTSTRSVTFDNLQVIRSGAGGRILQIQDRELVSLYNTLFSNGAAGDGANVWMSGPDTILYLNGSTIYSGDATGSGGGIFCSNGGTVLFDSGRIGGNTAVANGAGVYLDNCTMNSFAGSDQKTLACPFEGSGIVCNVTASGNGGGVYLTNGAALNLLGGAAAPASVSENNAEFGGGIYATGPGTVVEGHNVSLIHNLAGTKGAGIYVRNGASLAIDSNEPDCSRGAECSLFERNFASSIGAIGGAVVVDTNAGATIYKTAFTQNDAGLTGSVVYVDGAGSTLTMEGILAHHDSGSLNDAFLQADHGGFLRVAFATIDEDTGCCKGLFDTNNAATVEVYSSILMSIHDIVGGGVIFDDPPGAGESRFADCILYQGAASTLPPPPDLQSFEVLVNEASVFAGYAQRDYRLRRGSQPVDFCDTFRYTPVTGDIEQQTRGYDDLTFPNSPWGPWDLGVDEWRPIFVGDFEPGNCSQWSANLGCP